MSKIISLSLSNDFKKLKKEGIRAYPSAWMCLSAIKNNQKEVRLGWTVSRKVASSVIRNKIKRWGKFYLRQNFKNQFYVDINIILKPRKDRFYRNLKYNEFIEVFEKGIQAIIVKIRSSAKKPE